MIASDDPTRSEALTFALHESHAETSAPLTPIMALARSAAQINCAILITGEGGVGKEVLADYIQSHSPRKAEPYMKINCAAFSEKLIESELFGYEAGAFAGALRPHVGRLERAIGGTVFLDEIGELSLAMQTKLLRVLQTKEIERLGGSEIVHVDFRLICATHRSVESLKSEGTFNRDLFYRISTVPIHIPPLRERRGEIPELARAFIERNQKKLRCAPEEIDAEALALLQSHHWPGNIRELENCLECACLLARERCLHASDIWWLKVEKGQDAPAPEPFTTLPAQSSSDEPALTLLEQSELQTLRRTLEEHNWNYSHTAEALNVSRSTLYLKAGKYGLAGRRKHNRVHRAQTRAMAERELQSEPPPPHKIEMEHASAAGE